MFFIPIFIHIFFLLLTLFGSWLDKGKDVIVVVSYRVWNIVLRSGKWIGFCINVYSAEVKDHGRRGGVGRRGRRR